MITENNIGNSISDTNTMVTGSAAPMASANTFIPSSHSTGILFENSVRQQQSDFELGITETTKSTELLLNNGAVLNGLNLTLNNDMMNSFMRGEIMAKRTEDKFTSS